MMAAVIPFHRKLANRITMEVVTLSPCFSRKLLSLQWLPLLQLQYQRTRLRFARVGDIASRDEESVQHPNAGAADLQHPQQSNGFRPHPDAWVRKSLQGKPQMEAWLALMNEVGHFFPAKGVSKEIGKNSKVAYSDWVIRFVDWHNAKYGTAQPAHLAMPSGIALGAEEAERARTAVPHHLTMLPTPSLRLLVEFLEAMFRFATWRSQAR